MYESYADAAIGWRPGAKKILLNFGDNVPHDDNLNEGVPGKVGIWSTGGDPGRDEIMFTPDDLDLQTVLLGMAANRVTLIEAHTTAYAKEYWDFWTGLTGGATFITTSATLVTDVVAKITSELAPPEIQNLHLTVTPGYESWLVEVEPPSYSGPRDVTVEFKARFCVPAGTPFGDYAFTISAVDDEGVVYATHDVTVHVRHAAPPEVKCWVETDMLWPANHDMVNVGLNAVAVSSSGGPVTISVRVYGDEDDEEASGDGRHSPDALNIAPRTLRLRAERKGDADGRVYLIVVSATDEFGNVGVCCATVVVPHSMSKAAIDAVKTQAADAKHYFMTHAAPPPGYYLIGDGPVIGPKQ